MCIKTEIGLTIRPVLRKLFPVYLWTKIHFFASYNSILLNEENEMDSKGEGIVTVKVQ